MSITSANAIIAITIPGLFDQPFQLQDFGPDAIFGTDPINAAEEMMGVDGSLTAGFVNVPVMQNYTLLADSPANFLFDQWYFQQKALQDTFVASGIIILRSVQTKWSMVKGFLKTYQPLPEAAKVLQPRKHTIVWQTTTPQPVF